jgi:uncharacterized protein (TIGR00369 family)
LSERATDREFERRVRASFARQRVMASMGASLTRVEAGAIEIELPFDGRLTQQHGFLHAGVITTMLDSACGYAALSLMDPSAEVLAIEFKVNFLAPAVGGKLVARASVVRAGRTITVCRADGYMASDAGELHVATMVATMMAVRGGEPVRE